MYIPKLGGEESELWGIQGCALDYTFFHTLLSLSDRSHNISHISLHAQDFMVRNLWAPQNFC